MSLKSTIHNRKLKKAEKALEDRQAIIELVKALLEKDKTKKENHLKTIYDKLGQNVESFLSSAEEELKKSLIQEKNKIISEVESLKAIKEKDIKRSLSSIESNIEDNFNKKSNAILSEIRSNIEKMRGSKGEPGEKGQDGSFDKPEDIAKKLNKTEESVEMNVIKGLLQELKQIKQIKRKGGKYGGGSSKLSELSDVDDTGKDTDKVLKYNAVSGNWEVGDDNDTTYSSGDFNLSDLADVDDTDKAENKILKVDSEGNHIYADYEAGTDEKVKYNSEDPTAGYLADKIIAGDGISLAEGMGADENKLVVTNDDKGSDYTETDPIVGAIDGIVKADGAGNISAATAGTDYLAPGGWYDADQDTINLSDFNDDLSYENPLTFGTGLTRTGDTIDCDITQYTDADAVAAIKADEDWNATDWDTAFGWGDHATEGYLKNIESESIGDLSDVDLTGIANDKILKYNSTSGNWEIADDENTEYTAGTGLTLTGTEFSTKDSEIDHNELKNYEPNEHIDWTVSQTENINQDNLPALAITEVFSVADDTERDALTVQEGDIAIVDDSAEAGNEPASYIYNGTDWKKLKTPTDAVSSVFGRTGDVIAETNDYTWAQIDKTVSDIADITDRSHTDLTDIGTNTHSQIDTHIADSSIHFSDLSGFDTGDLDEGTNLYFTDARAVSAIKDDEDWNADDWDTAFSWGNHADAGYFKLDQTTPQTVTGGTPVFEEGIILDDDTTESPKLTFGNTTQDYSIYSGTVTGGIPVQFFRGETSGMPLITGFVTKDADGTDDNILFVVGAGSPSDFDDRHLISIGWSSVDSNYLIESTSNGTQDTQPLKISVAGSNSIDMDTDGTFVFENDVDLSSGGMDAFVFQTASTNGFTSSSGIDSFFHLSATMSQSDTAGYTMQYMNVDNSAFTGSGLEFMTEWAVEGLSVFDVDIDGNTRMGESLTLNLQEDAIDPYIRFNGDTNTGQFRWDESEGLFQFQDIGDNYVGFSSGYNIKFFSDDSSMEIKEYTLGDTGGIGFETEAGVIVGTPGAPLDSAVGLADGVALVDIANNNKPYLLATKQDLSSSIQLTFDLANSIFEFNSDINVTGDVILSGELQGSRQSTSFTYSGLGSYEGYFQFGTVDCSATEGFVAVRDGSIVGVAASMDVVNHSVDGDYTYEVRKNGTKVFETTVTITGNGRFHSESTQARDTDTFSAGDIISVYGTQDSGEHNWADMMCSVEFVYDS